MLKERFGKPQIIISAHVDEMLKIQASTDGRLSSLLYVYDKISVNVRGLALLGVQPEQYGSLLIPIVMSKLASDVRLQIARKNSSEIWKIDELLEAVKTEIEARESSEGARASAVDIASFQIITKPRHHSELVHFSQRHMQEDFKIRCAFCNNLHYSASCDVVQSYESRKQILAKAGRCYNCIRKGHQVKECSVKRIVDTVVNVITSQYVIQCMQRESKKPKKNRNKTTTSKRRLQLQRVTRIEESEIVFFCKLHGQ